MWSIYFYIKPNKCGQTSRAVVGADIQTSCNIKASPNAHQLCFWLLAYTLRGLRYTSRGAVLT